MARSVPRGCGIRRAAISAVTPIAAEPAAADRQGHAQTERRNRPDREADPGHGSQRIGADDPTGTPRGAHGISLARAQQRRERAPQQECGREQTGRCQQQGRSGGELEPPAGQGAERQQRRRRQHARADFEQRVQPQRGDGPVGEGSELPGTERKSAEERHENQGDGFDLAPGGERHLARPHHLVRKSRGPREKREHYRQQAPERTCFERSTEPPSGGIAGKFPRWLGSRGKMSHAGKRRSGAACGSHALLERLLGLMPCVLLAALLGGLPAGRAAGQITPQIVNGAPEFAEPTSAALLQGLDPATAVVVCSAVLIGCDTAITAGHCFNTNASLRRTLFFQHAGFHAIESAIRHPVYAAYYDQGIGDYYTVTRQEDIALIKLATPVSGITPSPINTTQTPGSGTPGRVVGFGRDPRTEVSSFQQNAGIKRSGSMALAACQDATLSPYDLLCWDPSEVIGDPGTEVSTCNVDSGGPLFVDQAGVKVVAGLTKGALQPTGSCIPPVEAFDTNVFRHRQWIAQAAAQLGAVDLSVTNCGSLPQLDTAAVAGSCNGLPWGGAETTRVCGFDGELSAALPQEQHVIQVPADTQRLRVTLNGVSRTTNPVDVNLYVRAGAPPTTSVYDCAGVATGNFAACEFAGPQAGAWYVLAMRVTGTVGYQITATEFGPLDADGDGVPDASDNCPYEPNADQTDSGGVDTPVADGIGDACQCGDVNDDGAVTSSDATMLARALINLSPAFSVGGNAACTAAGAPASCCTAPGTGSCDPGLGAAGLAKCNVAATPTPGIGGCTSSDATVISRALASLSPGIAQGCDAAQP